MIYIDEQMMQKTGICSMATSRVIDGCNEPYTNVRALIESLQEKANAEAAAIVRGKLENPDLDTSYVSGRWEAFTQVIDELKRCL